MEIKGLLTPRATSTMQRLTCSTRYVNDYAQFSLNKRGRPLIVLALANMEGWACVNVTFCSEAVSVEVGSRTTF